MWVGCLRACCQCCADYAKAASSRLHDDLLGRGIVTIAIVRKFGSKAFSAYLPGAAPFGPPGTTVLGLAKPRPNIISTYPDSTSRVSTPKRTMSKMA